MVDNSSCGEQRQCLCVGRLRAQQTSLQTFRAPALVDVPETACCCVAAFPRTGSYWREEEERRELDKNRSIWMEM